MMCETLLQGLGLLQYGRRAYAANTAADASQQQAASADQQAPAVAGPLQQSCKVAGKTWTFETGRLADLAHGSCLVTVGGTSVLGTAVVDPTPQLEADGVPLQVLFWLVAEWRLEAAALHHLHTLQAHAPKTDTQGGQIGLVQCETDPVRQPLLDGLPPTPLFAPPRGNTLPLAPQVEYRERMSAAGRLPSRPDRRERVGTEREVLAARLIDRALRPLLPPGFLYDTQVDSSLRFALMCCCFVIKQQTAAFDGACAHGVKHLHVSDKTSKACTGFWLDSNRHR